MAILVHNVAPSKLCALLWRLCSVHALATTVHVPSHAPIPDASEYPTIIFVSYTACQLCEEYIRTHDVSIVWCSNENLVPLACPTTDDEHVCHRICVRNTKECIKNTLAVFRRTLLTSLSAPPNVRICFITAIYGGYEQTCKPFAPQTVPTDLVCFTDNPHICGNGWEIDNTPYHLTHKSHLDDCAQVNSLSNNQHTFNVAKYYKQAFTNIPRLKEYEVVVWLDGTIEVTNARVSEYILRHIHSAKIIGWHHEHRYGMLQDEVVASHFHRYTSTFWNNQAQPYQDVDRQYSSYLADGYTDAYFKNMHMHTPHFGVWITCFVAFLQHDPDVSRFLDMWYTQTLQHTTQDQIGFSYVCQMSGLSPMTLPNEDVSGVPSETTDFYVKHTHGK